MSRETEGSTDFTDDILTDGALGIGAGPVTGALTPVGDRDWVAVQVFAGEVYVFDLQGAESGVGTLVDPYLRLRDGEGTLLAFDDDGGAGRESRIRFEADADDTLYFSVGAYSDSGTGSWALFGERLVDDHADTLDGATPIDLADSPLHAGSQRSGDQDWFEIDLTAGQTYLFEVDADVSFAGTAVSILDGDGGLIGFGSSGQYSFTAPRNDSYFVRIGVSRVTDYDLTIEIPSDDYGNLPASAGVLAPGSGPATGEIEYYNDRDWFAVDLEAGQTYRFGTSGDPENGTALRTPYLRLYDGFGGQLARSERFPENPDARYDAFVDFTAPETGRYHVSVSGIDGSWLSLGNYKLEATAQPDDFAATPLTKGLLLENGAAVAGRLDYTEDRDWFAFDAQDAVELRLTGGGDLAVFDAAMEQQSLAGPLFSPGAPGRYFVQVSGGDTDYTIRVISPDLKIGRDRDGVLIARNGTSLDGGGGDDLVIGLRQDDILTGGNGDDVVNGKAGDDTVLGGNGDDNLFGGTGCDIVIGEAGDDGMTGGWGIDTFRTGLGDDTVHDFLPGFETILVDAHQGNIGDVLDAGFALLNGALLEFESGTLFLEGVDLEDLDESDFQIVETGAPYTATVVRFGSLSDDMPEDLPAGLTTPRQLVIDGLPFSGGLRETGDEDWLSVELAAGSVYRFDVYGNSPIYQGTDRGSLEDARLRLYDDQGTLLSISTEREGEAVATKYVKVDTTGTYYIAVTGGDGRETGSYQLTAVESFDTEGTDRATAGRLALDGERIWSAINIAGDRDMYAVDLLAGETYQFWAFSGTCERPFLRLYREGPDGEPVLVDEGDPFWVLDTSGLGLTAAVEITTSGRYWVEVAGDLDDRDTGTYLIAGERIEDDFGTDAASSGQVIVNGEATAGEIGSGEDTDHFLVDLVAGTTYEFTLTAGDDLPSGNRDRLVYADFSLLALDGSLLSAAASDGAIPLTIPTIRYTAETTGQATLSVAAYQSVETLDETTEIVETSVGAYSLSARVFEDTIPGDTSSSVGLGSDGELVQAYSETPNDEDWFRIELSAGATYAIEMESDFSTLPVLKLYDSAGNLISSGVGSFVQRIVFTAPETGVYFAAASVSYATIERNGYTIRATELADDYGDRPETAGVVLAGELATGRIDYGGDIDLFAIELSSGVPYALTLGGGSDDALTRSHLAIRDGDGVLLAEASASEGADAALTFASDAGGTYFAEVSASFSSLTGDYTLSLLEPEDDLPGDAGTRAVLFPDAEPRVAKLDYDGDADWFAIDLKAGAHYALNFVGAGDAEIDGLTPDDEGFYTVATDTRAYVVVADGLGDYSVSVLTEGTASAPADGTWIRGTSKADHLVGGDGPDHIWGRNGADVLLGGKLDDLLRAGPGDDLVAGESGNDLVKGGLGNDTFVYVSGTDGLDEITDFTIGRDHLLWQGADPAMVLDHAIAAAGGVLLRDANTPAGDGLFLHGVALTELSVADFV